MDKSRLRSGFTTGTCAAGAAKAAAVLLLLGERLDFVNIMTPKGTEAVLPLFRAVLEDRKVVCAVRKDAGDDPDVTDGALVFASVEFGKLTGEGFYEWKADGGPEDVGELFLTAGDGIGRVTKAGLSCPVGFPAINPVPREMIFEQVRCVQEQAGRFEPLVITVWMPEGVQLAEKTFNPKLGIVGGLSILGTSGVVEPMSEAALMTTISLEIHMKAAEGKRELILTPGNYGETFLREKLGLSLEAGVQCSNFLKFAFAKAREEGIEQVLFVGHLGKLIKAAGGAENTHSKYGDHRMEILWDCVRQCGKEDEPELKDKILAANTTEEGASLLQEAGICGPVMQEVVRRIKYYGERWSGGRCRVEVVVFTLKHGILGMTGQAGELIEALGGEKIWQE